MKDVMLMTGKREQLIRAAREMRITPTRAEKVLWEALRNRKLVGLKFRRQHVVGSIIVDYYCANARLVVEVDGEIHDYQEEYDSIRTKHLEDFGYHVIRFTNDRISNNLENVLAQIKVAAFGRISNLTPNPTPENRRGEPDLTPHNCVSSKTGSAPLHLESGKGSGDEVGNKRTGFHY